MPPESMHLYGFKRAADDIAALAKELGAPQIILGGHDWYVLLQFSIRGNHGLKVLFRGGMIVYRTAQWHPELVTHVFSVCTPFMPNTDHFTSTQDLVQGPLPQFGYQLQFAGPELEEALQTREQYQQFFKGLFGGRSQSGRPIMRPETGVDFEVLAEPIGDSPLVDATEIEYYVNQYSRQGMHGPCNWYRNREANFEDEKKLSPKTVDQPTLFILGSNENILTRDLSAGMEAYVSRLTRREVPTGHWALWQAPDKVNGHIKEWLEAVVFGGKSTL